MAAPLGRGAQERLTGDEQALARGANGRRLIDNVRDKAAQDAIDALSTEAPFDEVLTPAGLLPGFSAGGEPGVSISAVNAAVSAAISAEAQARINAITLEGQARTNAIAAETALRIAAVTAAVATAKTYTDGKIAALPVSGGGTTTPTNPTPNPDPAPATGIADRTGTAIKTRTGDYLEFRIPVVVTQPDSGQPITIPAGSIVARNGTPVTDRSAVILQFRTQPDSTVVTPVDPTEPVTTDGPYPSGAYLKLEAPHGNVIIESQDGTNAVVRLVRPIYWLDRLMNVSHYNTTLGNTNTFYTYKGPNNLLTITNDHPTLTRDITSLDDGEFTTQILETMSNGSFLELNVTFKIAPTRTGAVPAPSPIPPKDSVIFREEFAPGTGTGALNRVYGNAQNMGNGSVRLLGRASAMTQTDPANRISNDYGFGNGRYEYDVEFIGDLGNLAGPALVLWPASDNWPGPEVDLGEFFADGRMYMALHWKDATKPVANNGQNQNTIWPLPVGFNPYVRNILAADLLTDKVIFYVNGVEFARDDFSPAPKDFVHGGENHTLGLLSGSDQSSNGGPSGLICWSIQFTPEALLPPA